MQEEKAHGNWQIWATWASGGRRSVHGRGGRDDGLGWAALGVVGGGGGGFIEFVGLPRDGGERGGGKRKSWRKTGCGTNLPGAWPWVVGNGDYSSLTPLQNAVKDAQDVAGALEDVGFSVTTMKDLKRMELGWALTEFLDRVGPGDVALFYFAGHGVEVDGGIYALSTDHEGTSDTEVRLNELNVQQVAIELNARSV